MKRTHSYKKYEEYLEHQLEKTSDKNKQSKWLGEEWLEKIEIFKILFKRNEVYLKNKDNAICLGSRTGQEVVALQELGVTKCIGIDLHEFKPYTIKGDIHELKFKDNIFDLAFSNILDHSLYPEKFASEVSRVLKKDGIFILHVQLGIEQDKYTEIVINDKDYIVSLFKNFTLLDEKVIESGKIAMNYEFVFKK